MAVSVSNLVINQGSDFTTSIILNDASGNPLDLTTFTGISQLRKHYGSNTYTNFNVTFATPKTGGTITLTLTHVQTKNLASGRYVYDVVLIDAGGNRTRVLEGIATVVDGVTF
jgi:hypothetical protein